METITGVIDKIIYNNPQNNYTVLDIDVGGVIVSATGIVVCASEGEAITATGQYYVHPNYGEQFKINSVVTKAPEDKAGLFVFLSGSGLKGIGEKRAVEMINLFGTKVLEVIEKNPMSLTQINGIGKSGAMKIHEDYISHKEEKDSIAALAGYGLSTAVAMKLYKKYGANAARVVQLNPYKLIDDIYGIGFLKADAIAMKAGVAHDSPKRVNAGIKYYLSRMLNAGDVYTSEENLISGVAQALSVQRELTLSALDRLVISGVVVRENALNETRVYTEKLYLSEVYCAKKLTLMSYQPSLIKKEEVEYSLKTFEKSLNMKLDEVQRTAVITALIKNVSVITGGPGTGKTTIIKTIINILKANGMDYALCAPTGRAAKRMSEACGSEAKTIHRLLEYAYSFDDSEKITSDSAPQSFGRDQDNPIDADVIIVDEMSMVDMPLFCSLLMAISPKSALILVGDADQLPSVGPGNVLNDIIESESIDIIRLKKIYRQKDESSIIISAHKINNGEIPDYTELSGDFAIYEAIGQEKIADAIQRIMKKDYRGYAHMLMKDELLVLTPFKKGTAGTDTMNESLKNILNPQTQSKLECKIGDIALREGDKVMQTRNNYNIKWLDSTTLEPGEGIFNGDVGFIQSIDNSSRKIYVLMNGDKQVEYSFEEAESLCLAYAITIHKSQGCEYKTVIIALPVRNPAFMTRNLLYTGVTRAKDCVLIIGEERTVNRMTQNNSSQKRLTALCERLRSEA